MPIKALRGPERPQEPQRGPGHSEASFSSNSHIGKPLFCETPNSPEKASKRALRRPKQNKQWPSQIVTGQQEFIQNQYIHTMIYEPTAATALCTAAITLLHSGIHVYIYRHMDRLFWREICVHVGILVLCAPNNRWISETL